MSSVEGSHCFVIKFFDASEQRAASFFRMGEFVQLGGEHVTQKNSHHFNNGYEHTKLVMIKLHRRLTYCKGNIP